MAEVFLNPMGNGTATTDAIPPMVDGETFTVYFHPDPGEELLDVRAFDSHDYPIAIPAHVTDELTMRFRSGWGNIYFDIYFSGSTPPEEPPFPYWILGLRKWWMMKY